MKFITFQGADGRWYWRCGPSHGGRRTADGSQGYATRAGCRLAVRRHIRRIRVGNHTVD